MLPLVGEDIIPPKGLESLWLFYVNRVVVRL